MALGLLPGFRRVEELWAADARTRLMLGDRQVPERSRAAGSVEFPSPKFPLRDESRLPCYTTRSRVVDGGRCQ